MYVETYTGDGTTTEFSFAFTVFQEADVRVSVNGVILPDGYTVSLNENNAGGKVILTTPPPVSAAVSVFRQTVLTRQAEFLPDSTIDPASLNADLDFLLEAMKDLQSVSVGATNLAITAEQVKAYLSDTLAYIQQENAKATAMMTEAQNQMKMLTDYGSINDPVD